VESASRTRVVLGFSVYGQAFRAGNGTDITPGYGISTLTSFA